MKKILVPLDGSKNSLRGLDLAFAFTKPLGTVIGLNILQIPPSVTISSSLKSKEMKKSEEIIKRAELISQKKNVAFTGISKIDNNIGHAIVDFAANHMVDMIVIGSRGSDPELDMFLGSVANYVVNKSKIPVTVVK